MTALQITLVIIGLIIFGGSFAISERITISSEQLKAAIDVNEVKKLILQQINNMNGEIEEAMNEVVGNSMDEVKRAMEKLSNEKIMAINEYSDTVMDSINKNHNEVMFLYGMLNDKNKEIKETAELITKANKGINKKIIEAQQVIAQMDVQIVEMTKLTVSQTESMNKLVKSATTIEILENQIHNIEQMAMQFSNDIKSEKSNVHQYKVDLSEDVTISEVLKTKEWNDESEDFTESENSNMESLIKEEECEQDRDLEEILVNFDYEKQADYNINETEVFNNNNKILELSKNGLSALEIAKNLGLGVGEVQLVIDLFEGRKR
ncbi:MAG: DUF6115 domain-containing protein [Lachnotalea sp.]